MDSLDNQASKSPYDFSADSGDDDDIRTDAGMVERAPCGPPPREGEDPSPVSDPPLEMDVDVASGSTSMVGGLILSFCLNN
mmetsp:Transcript_20980/g.37780  ORF Transcript_20980/g.37780 Transcript_20980/m.37780 type:complete len:81 (+) Transcript_20980:769-1011(+)